MAVLNVITGRPGGKKGHLSGLLWYMADCSGSDTISWLFTWLHIWEIHNKASKVIAGILITALPMCRNRSKAEQMWDQKIFCSPETNADRVVNPHLGYQGYHKVCVCGGGGEWPLGTISYRPVPIGYNVELLCVYVFGALGGADFWGRDTKFSAW